MFRFKMHVCLELTQVPVRQGIVVIILVVVDVLPFLALPAFVLQGDRARLVETGLDVLLAVWNGFILFNVTLQDSREKVGSREKKAGRLYQEWQSHPSWE